MYRDHLRIFYSPPSAGALDASFAKKFDLYLIMTGNLAAKVTFKNVISLSLTKVRETC